VPSTARLAALEIDVTKLAALAMVSALKACSAPQKRHPDHRHGGGGVNCRVILIFALPVLFS
jgi:hypothetical protein